MQIQQSNVTYANVPIFMRNASNSTQGLAGLTLSVSIPFTPAIQFTSGRAVRVELAAAGNVTGNLSVNAWNSQ